MTLQKTEQKSLGPVSSPYMGGIDSSDSLPPEYRLMQGLSAAVAKNGIRPGTFYAEGAAAGLDKLEGVIVAIQKTRVLWTKGELGAPVCGSDDSITARTGAEYAGRACNTCPLADDECSTGYTFIGLLNGEAKKPFIFRAQSRTSLRTAKNFITAIQMEYESMPFRARVRISSASTTNKQNQSYFVPQMVVLGAVETHLATVFQAIADSFVRRRKELLGAPDGTDSDGVPHEGTTPATAPAQNGHTQTAQQTIHTQPLMRAAAKAVSDDADDLF